MAITTGQGRGRLSGNLRRIYWKEKISLPHQSPATSTPSLLPQVLQNLKPPVSNSIDEWLLQDSFFFFFLKEKSQIAGLGQMLWAEIVLAALLEFTNGACVG